MGDYSSIKADVEDLSHRGVDDTLMALLIRLVENQVNRRIRTQQMVVKRTLIGETVAGQFMYSIPSDALSFSNIETENEGRRYPLKLMSQEALDTTYGSIDGGVPQAYSIVGLQFELQPCPNAAYPLRITYHAKVPPLTTVDTENWLSLEHDDVYIFGCLQFLSAQVRDAEGMKMWSELYGNALTEVQISDDINEWSGATPQMVAG